MAQVKDRKRGAAREVEGPALFDLRERLKDFLLEGV